MFARTCHIQCIQRTATKSTTAIRCQSSLPVAKAVLSKTAKAQAQQEQELRAKKQAMQAKLQQQQQRELLQKCGTSTATKGTLKLRKGFSNVTKVPSTISLEPKEVLLDKLYQGFNPLLTPIMPKKKVKAPKILVNIYEDLIYDEDGFENEDPVQSVMGPNLQISKFIFDKNPEVEAKLRELELQTKNNKTNNTGAVETLFEERDTTQARRGRSRLMYKKNAPKSAISLRSGERKVKSKSKGNSTSTSKGKDTNNDNTNSD